MKWRLFGHAAVGLTAKRTPRPGLRILIDPLRAPAGFGGQIGYPPIDFDPDLILITHAHADHSHTAPFPNARVIGPDAWPDRVPDDLREAIGLRALVVDHDAWGRAAAGWPDRHASVCDRRSDACPHGDIGELPPPSVLGPFLGQTPVDTLFLSCGGYYTLGPVEARELALRVGARAVVPMHAATEACTLPHMVPVGGFERLWG